MRCDVVMVSAALQHDVRMPRKRLALECDLPCHGSTAVVVLGAMISIAWSVAKIMPERLRQAAVQHGELRPEASLGPREPGSPKFRPAGSAEGRAGSAEGRGGEQRPCSQASRCKVEEVSGRGTKLAFWVCRSSHSTTFLPRRGSGPQLRLVGRRFGKERVFKNCELSICCMVVVADVLVSHAAWRWNMGASSRHGAPLLRRTFFGAKPQHP